MSFKRVITAILLGFLIMSCSKNMEDKDKSVLIDYTVETLSSSQLVGMLMIENNYDIKQLSRVLGCSIHTLRRVKGGSTVFTDLGEQNVKTLLKGVLFEKRINQHDPEKRGIWNKIKYVFVSRSFNNEFETNLDWKWEEPIN